MYTLLIFSDHPSMAMRSCSQDFLDALVSDLHAVQWEYSFSYKKMSRQAAKQCLQKIFQECTRLTTSPELFPSGTSTDKFFKLVNWHATKIVRSIACWKRRVQRRKAHVQFMTKRYYNRSRRHFAKGPKPWQQFLGRDAPGSGTGIRAPSKNLSCQIVPWAGVRILCGWSKECKDIIKYIEDVGTHR